MTYLTLMQKKEALNLVKKLVFDKEKVILKEEKAMLSILRPSKLKKQFKTYDVKKNFQIFLTEGERKFRPNHLRVMIDLFLRSRSRPDLKESLLLAFDRIFYGEDPEIALKKLKKEKFEHHLSSIMNTGYLAQFFLIEQEYAYNRESNYEPPTLFFQGWVRQFIDAEKEVDNLCMSLCRNQPPVTKYTALEDKKNKKYSVERVPLWYLK